VTAPVRFESLLQRLERSGPPSTPVAAEIPHERISRDETQVRKVFDETLLDELAATIRAVGIIEPLVVRPDPDRPEHFRLIAGERRWLAAGRAGLPTVPAIVRETSEPGDVKLIQLIENLQRVDLSLKERAEGLRDLEESTRLPGKELAKLLGMAPGTLSNYKRVLRATGPAAEAVEHNLISSPETLRVFENLDREQQESLLKGARKSGTPISRPVVMRFLERASRSSGPAGKDEQTPEAGAAPPGGKAPQPRPKLELRHYESLFELLGLPPSGDLADMQERLFAFLESRLKEN
jgi:ParB/RepB/Spo0J family partition protein